MPPLRTVPLLLQGLFVLGEASPAISAEAIPSRPVRPVSSAIISISAQATPVERFAAEELQSYLQQISTVPGQPPPAKQPILLATGLPGRSPKFEILIGRAANYPGWAGLAREAGLNLTPAALGSDGYILKTHTAGEQTTLFLTGAQDRSCLYAVYHLLETLGVGFYGYRDRGGEVIPHSSAPVIPDLDVVEKPRMRYRFVSDNNFSASDKIKLAAVADWAAKNRCNAFMIAPSRAGETWEQVALEEVRKRGLMIAGPGHILARLTPDKSLFEAHPEYFPLLNGRRQAPCSAAWGGVASFCHSNAEAMRIVVANAMQYIEQNPWIDLFALYPPDGSQRGAQCQCAECAKMSTSERYLTLMNHVAAALETRHPATKLMWISYNECGVPPVRATPYHEGRNMILLWCNDLRDLHQAMEDPANRHAAPYLEWKPRLKTIKTDGMKNPSDEDLASWYRWQAWSRYLKGCHYLGDVVLLEYYNQHVANSLHLPWLGYCQSGPWPRGIMSRDFQFYEAQGIAGWQNCTDYYNDTPNPYWNWLSAQLLWNPSSNVAALEARFYGQFYGLAGPAMQRYFAGLWPEVAGGEVTEAAVARAAALEKLLVTAEAAARTTEDPILSKRMEAARAFQLHCVKRKRQLMEQYRADGSPRS